MTEDLEADWLELEGLRQPRPQDGACLDDLLEDWDHLQGRESWFVALVDGDGFKLPGAVIRSSTLQGELLIEVPYGGTTYGALYWSRTQKPVRVHFAKVRVTPGAYVKLRLGTVTFSNSTMNVPLNFTTMGSNMTMPINITFSGTGANY